MARWRPHRRNRMSCRTDSPAANNYPPVPATSRSGGRTDRGRRAVVDLDVCITAGEQAGRGSTAVRLGERQSLVCARQSRPDVAAAVLRQVLTSTVQALLTGKALLTTVLVLGRNTHAVDDDHLVGDDQRATAPVGIIERDYRLAPATVPFMAPTARQPCHCATQGTRRHGRHVPYFAGRAEWARATSCGRANAEATGVAGGSFPPPNRAEYIYSLPAAAGADPRAPPPAMPDAEGVIACAAGFSEFARLPWGVRWMPLVLRPTRGVVAA